MPILEINTESTSTIARISRPETMNAINFEMMDELEALIDQIEKDPEIRLFILTGSENNFISGGDLREFHQIQDAEGAKKMSSRMISILTRIEQLNCWTLAAINGQTYGGGWEMMLYFDFRIAADTAKIGFTQGKFYLPPGWGGIHKLCRAVGREQALYWLATRKVIDAKTALSHGLIQEVVPEFAFGERVQTLRQTLTANDRTYISYIKSRHLKSPDDELDPFTQFWVSEEHLRRVDEFLSRKKE